MLSLYSQKVRFFLKETGGTVNLRERGGVGELSGGGGAGELPLECIARAALTSYPLPPAFKGAR